MEQGRDDELGPGTVSMQELLGARHVRREVARSGVMAHKSNRREGSRNMAQDTLVTRHDEYLGLHVGIFHPARKRERQAMAGKGVDTFGPEELLGVNVAAPDRLMPAKELHGSVGKQLRALKRTDMKSEDERRQLRVRRPFSPVRLEPAVQDNSDAPSRIFQCRRRFDFVVPIHEVRRLDPQPSEHAQSRNDLDMVAQVFRRDFQRGKFLGGIALGGRDRRSRRRFGAIPCRFFFLHQAFEDTSARHPIAREPVGALIEYGEKVEALGYDSLWVWDHILLGVNPTFPIMDSLTTLAPIAARPTRIQLGTGVLVLP